MYTYVGSDVHHDKHIEGFQSKNKSERHHPLQEIIANNQFFKGNTIFSKQKKTQRLYFGSLLLKKVATCLTIKS
jgi:hypothetical protein